MASSSFDQHFGMITNEDDIMVEAVRMQATYTRCPGLPGIPNRGVRADQAHRLLCHMQVILIAN